MKKYQASKPLDLKEKHIIASSNLIPCDDIKLVNPKIYETTMFALVDYWFKIGLLTKGQVVWFHKYWDIYDIQKRAWERYPDKCWD